MNLYEAIFNLECYECSRSPIVGLRSDEGTLQATNLCGTCFFCDRLMEDPDLWNNRPESTE
jgi:hypothetical protein